MTEHEFEGRLKKLMEVDRKITWYRIGQYVLGALTALAVVGLMMILFLMEE